MSFLGWSVLNIVCVLHEFHSTTLVQTHNQLQVGPALSDNVKFEFEVYPNCSKSHSCLSCVNLPTEPKIHFIPKYFTWYYFFELSGRNLNTNSGFPKFEDRILCISILCLTWKTFGRPTNHTHLSTAFCQGRQRKDKRSKNSFRRRLRCSVNPENATTETEIIDHRENANDKTDRVSYVTSGLCFLLFVLCVGNQCLPVISGKVPDSLQTYSPLPHNCFLF